MTRVREDSHKDLRFYLGCAGTSIAIILVLLAMMYVEPENPKIVVGNDTEHTLLVRVGDSEAVSVRPTKNIIVYYEPETSVRVDIEVSYAPHQGITGSAMRTVVIEHRGRFTSPWKELGDDSDVVIVESSQYTWAVQPADFKRHCEASP